MRHVAALIIAGAFCAASAAAQSISPNWVFGSYQQLSWQDRDGLPQNTVLAITSTRDGYLWIGTYGGAARFDGVRFRTFTPSNTTGLANAVVTSIVETRNGDIWFGTFGGGVSRLSNGRFTAYGVKDGLSHAYVKSLLEDRAGTLWIATDGGGVTRFRDGRFSVYTISDGLPSNRVRALLEDGDGSLLVGTNEGIARIASGAVSAYPAPARVARVGVQVLARDREGALWIGGLERGLSRVDARGVTEFGAADGFPNDVVEALSVDETGAVWVGTYANGLFRYFAGRFERHAPADGPPGARVAAIARSADHALWIGTDEGLVRLKAPRFTSYTKRDGLADERPASIVEDVEHSVWIGSGRGLTRFKDGAFTVYTTRNGLPDDYGRDLALGVDGFPLVRTRRGVARWTGRGFEMLADSNEVPWNRVTTLVQDRAGAIRIAIADEGLVRLHDNRVTRLTKQDGLADNSVLVFFEARDGSMWVGTFNGVTRISSGKTTSWYARDGLASNHVTAFHQDASGTIWIGTHGGGMSRFKDGRFATISARQGLYDDFIFQIVEDADANLWMNGNAGIWSTSLAQLNDVADGRRPRAESFAYGRIDGMLSSEGIGGTLAGWKRNDGSLWFPTTKGVVVVDPQQRDTMPPRVVIEDVTIDREPVQGGQAVRVLPGHENVEIQYTGLSWSRPHAVSFRFRLTGLDRDWVEAGTRRTAYYSHLPPGSYTFNVTADNGEGVWNTAGATLAIVVLPRFYQTWWFRSVVVSSLVAFVWVSWRYRIAQMRRAQAAQQAFSRQLIESQERERQRIAAELHDSLGQSLLVVKNRALLGAMSQPGEQALTHFQEISAAAAQTLDEVRAISYDLRPHHLDQLGLTTTIGAMIEKVEKSAAIHITRELDDIDGLFPPSDEITIYRIIQESLNNVLKHSHATEAHVAVRSYEHAVDIVIRDNGQGFSRRDARDEAAGPGGFGLKGIAERVRMLGATHAIESAPGQGTTIRVRIQPPAAKGG